jgi:uncharacterized protein with HEPN domain
MRSQKLYLNDIVDSIKKILEYTKGIDYDEFTKNTMVFDAVIRNFEIIGEAAKNISEEIKSKYPNITWSDMIGMRNILIHSYFGIDYSIVWNTLELLPNLLEEMEKVQQDIEENESKDGQDTITPESTPSPEIEEQ